MALLVPRSTREHFPCSAKGHIRRALSLQGERNRSLMKNETSGIRTTAICFSVCASCRVLEPFTVPTPRARHSVTCQRRRQKQQNNNNTTNNKQQTANNVQLTTNSNKQQHTAHRSHFGSRLGSLASTLSQMTTSLLDQTTECFRSLLPDAWLDRIVRRLSSTMVVRTSPG